MNLSLENSMNSVPVRVLKLELEDLVGRILPGVLDELVHCPDVAMHDVNVGDCCSAATPTANAHIHECKP